MVEKILTIILSILIIATVVCVVCGLTIISLSCWIATVLIWTVLASLNPPKQKKIKSEKASVHFITADGYCRCKETDKAIRYPLVSYTDFEYCPCCGKKLNWEDEINVK